MARYSGESKALRTGPVQGQQADGAPVLDGRGTQRLGSDTPSGCHAAVAPASLRPGGAAGRRRWPGWRSGPSGSGASGCATCRGTPPGTARRRRSRSARGRGRGRPSSAPSRRPPRTRRPPGPGEATCRCQSASPCPEMLARGSCRVSWSVGWLRSRPSRRTGRRRTRPAAGRARSSASGARSEARARSSHPPAALAQPRTPELVETGERIRVASNTSGSDDTRSTPNSA